MCTPVYVPNIVLHVYPCLRTKYYVTCVPLFTYQILCYMCIPVYVPNIKLHVYPFSDWQILGSSKLKEIADDIYFKFD